MPNLSSKEDRQKRLALAGRVAEAIASLGRGGKAAIARRCDISAQSISGWLKTGRIDKANLSVVAEMAGYSLSWLITGHGEKQPRLVSGVPGQVAERCADDRAGVLIPLISWAKIELYRGCYLPLPPGIAEQWLPCPGRCSARTYALRVEGDSMTAPYPGQQSFTEGMLIYVDPERAPVNGSKVIARLGSPGQPDMADNFTFKVYREDGGKKWLMPINPAYGRIELVAGMQLCGVVIGAYMAV